MKFCDQNTDILQWSSEEVVVPYRSSIDGRLHRYYVDFWIKVRRNDGVIECKLIEIKPYRQTIKPEPAAKAKPKSKRYLTEVRNWVINNNKWDAAKQYCSDRNWEFLILTEKNLFKK